MAQKSKEDQGKIDLVLKFYKAFNARDFEVMEACLAPVHIDRTYFGKQAIDPKAIIRMLRGFFDIFPDWTESIDEIIVGEGDKVVVRSTGRGTQTKTFMGRAADNLQQACPLIDTLTIKDGKITEYRSTFPFTTPMEETIIAAEDVQEARAEQGGVEISAEQREGILRAYRDGEIDSGDVVARESAAEAIPNRCQALLEHNLRRCNKAALPDSLYCELHLTSGLGRAAL